MLLKFTNKGKFIMQIGKRDGSTGNADTKNVRQAADVYVYPRTNEAFVADGYTNRRIIVFDADTGAFKRLWGGTGSTPMDAPPVQSANVACRPPAPPGGAAGRGRGPAAPVADDDPGPQQFGSPVHSSIVSNDGLVYVADRANRRVQVFTTEGKYVSQVFINRNAGGGPGAAALSPDKDQNFLYVGDQNAHHMLVIDRKTLKVLYQFGMPGPEPGNFRAVHHMAVDSKGNLYTAEVNPGNRAQRFAFKGMSSTKPPNALTQEQRWRCHRGGEPPAVEASRNDGGVRLTSTDEACDKQRRDHPADRMPPEIGSTLQPKGSGAKTDAGPKEAPPVQLLIALLDLGGLRAPLHPVEDVESDVPIRLATQLVVPAAAGASDRLERTAIENGADLRGWTGAVAADRLRDQRAADGTDADDIDLNAARPG